MAIWRKDNASAIDRAVADLEKQIATVRQQVRVVETGGKPQSPVAVKAESVTKFVKEMLTPPKAKSPAPKPRRDLFEASAEPLKDLEAAPIAFSPQPSPDLFAHATTAQRIDCAPKADEKLAIYISAGSLKGFKRPLRVEQRRNRNRFFMWLGLACVALWFIWAVVR